MSKRKSEELPKPAAHTDTARAQGRIHGGLWPVETPVVGMVHLLPLPGSPGYNGSMEAVLQRARQDSARLWEGGVDGLLVENYGDRPFFPGAVPAATTAAMAAVVAELSSSAPVPVGVNVLRNDAAGALAVAAAGGARFIRVNLHTGSMFTDQGLLQGRAHETLRIRKELCPDVAILADVFVKHGTPPPNTRLEETARDTWIRGLADGLILTGTETGRPTELSLLPILRDALPPGTRIWIGSGVTLDNANRAAKVADGLIVGSAFQKGGVAGNGVEADRVHAVMDALDRK